MRAPTSAPAPRFVHQQSVLFFPLFRLRLLDRLERCAVVEHGLVLSRGQRETCARRFLEAPRGVEFALLDELGTVERKALVLELELVSAEALKVDGPGPLRLRAAVLSFTLARGTKRELALALLESSHLRLLRLRDSSAFRDGFGRVVASFLAQAFEGF
jgi:hypothetical protein